MPKCELCGQEFTPQGLAGHLRLAHASTKRAKPERSHEALLGEIVRLKSEKVQLEAANKELYQGCEALGKCASAMMKAFEESLGLTVEAFNLTMKALNVAKAWKEEAEAREKAVWKQGAIRI